MLVETAAGGGDGESSSTAASTLGAHIRPGRPLLLLFTLPCDVGGLLLLLMLLPLLQLLPW